MNNYDSKDLKSVLLYIKDEYGAKCFQDGRFINMLADLAPELKAEKNLLQKLYNKGFIEEIKNNSSSNEINKTSIIHKALDFLINEELVQEKAAVNVIRDYAELFSYTVSYATNNEASNNASVITNIVPSNVTKQNSKFDSLIERAFICLEDNEFTKADQLLEEVLNMNPKFGLAYVGKILVSLKFNSIDQLNKSAEFYEFFLRQESNYKRAIQYCEDDLKTKISEYVKNSYNEYIWVKATNLMNDNKNIKSLEEAANLFESIGNYKSSHNFADKCKQLIENIVFVEKNNI